MVICWIMGSVGESIARSIMFVGTASEIWQQLEKRIFLSDGSRKYKLNKDTYKINQSGSFVGESYTKMKCVWEELDNINVLPVLAVVTLEILVFLVALNKQKEEQRLFQFLNGLEENFGHQRSQILMIDPLPSVIVTCSLLQQEESQRLLFKSSTNIDSSALLCPQQTKQTKPGQTQGGQGRNQGFHKTAAHVESGNISFTPQQFEQLLKSIQQMSQFNAKEEIDHQQFVAGIACLSSHLDLINVLEDWIYDTGASDHMIPIEDNVFDPYQLKIKPHIRLPNRDNSVISHVGKVHLNNGILLKDVLVDLISKKVTRLGRLKEGLYHLLNVPADKVDSIFLSLVHTSLQRFSLSIVGNKSIKGSYGLWHHRLGHVSDVKMNQIHEILVSKSSHDNCLSCPMAKYTKLPYFISESRSTNLFELIHIDIWGPYKVLTHGKFRYFLTIVDDCSR
nr:hypothetical protein [Tanacetum cinerariifolium]